MGDKDIPAPTPGTPTEQAAIDAMKAEIGAVDPNTVGIYNLEAAYAATAILRALPAIKAQLPLLARLPDFEHKHVDQLETYAHALIHANALVIAHSPETSKFDELAVEARALREEFLGVCDVLVRRRLLAESAVDKIREGQGNLDLINDVSSLLAIVKEHRDGALVRHEDVALAEKLVAQLPGAYAQHTGKDPKLEPLLQLRRVIGAVVTFAYSEIVAGLRYMRRHHGDADTIAPSIYVPRGPGKKDAAEAAKPDRGPSPSPAPVPMPANPLVPSDNPFDGNKR